MNKLIFILILFVSCSKVDRYEVSVAEFRQFVNATGYKTTAEIYGWGILTEDVYMKNMYPSRTSFWWDSDGDGNIDSDDMPVTQISHHDACAYCDWAGGRLPTVQEWQEAAGDYTGGNIGNLKKAGEKFAAKWPVRNAGFFGNAYEWTQEVSLQRDVITGDTIQQSRLMGGAAICRINTCAAFLPIVKKYSDINGGTNYTGFRCKK